MATTTKKTTTAKKPATTAKKSTTAKKPASTTKKTTSVAKKTPAKTTVAKPTNLEKDLAKIKDFAKLTLLNKLGIIPAEAVVSNEKKPLINIEGLNVNFKRGGKLFEAVKNANLQIEDGEILGLVGESGSGKTTLGRATISLWDHALGKVEIEGKRTPNTRIKSVSKDNIWVYKKGQMIFQDPTSSLNRQSKVMDIVFEGLKNFETIENEYKEIIEEDRKKLEKLENFNTSISSLDAYREYLETNAENEVIVREILKPTVEELKEFLTDYSSFLEMSSRKEEVEEELNDLLTLAKKKIKIQKDKTTSDKLILSETSISDVRLLQESRAHELEEWKIFQDRFAKDEKKTTERVQRRIARFYKATINKAVKELPDNLQKLLPEDTSDVKAFQTAIEAFEADMDKEGKLDQKEHFYAKSISLTMKIIVAKLEKVVTPLNSTAYDTNYIFTDDVLMNAVHYYEKLVKDLDARMELERAKVETAEKANDDEEAHFHWQSVGYLEEYRKILVSMFKEYASVSITFKELLLSHEANGIEHFYKYAIKQSKANDQLKAALITWKSKKAIDYIKAGTERKKSALEKELHLLVRHLDELAHKHGDLNEPSERLLKILLIEIATVDRNLKVTPDDIKAAQQEHEHLLLEMATLREKIQENEAILKNKKKIKEISIERIKETLIKVGLQEDALNKYPSQFSGGQKQRIGIARTIINKPKFIIADEPISALDVSVQAQVINLMKEINDDTGLTMLFIAHDLQMVHYISDKIAVIYRGNIVEYGTADEVYNKPIHPYTKSLIGAMPSLEEIGKPLEVSNYSWAQHEYNEFSATKLHVINKDHQVFGTEEEIKEWTKK